MFKLRIAILKDLRILLRDKAGLAIMFLMPILLVIVMAIVQNSTFKLVNDKKVPVVICNRDGGESSMQLAEALDKMGMFTLTPADSNLSDKQLTDFMHSKDALIAIVVPKGFSAGISSKAHDVADKALHDLGVASDNKSKTQLSTAASTPVTMFYNPVIQEAFRFSVEGALRSAQQFTEHRQILQAIYQNLNNQKLPDSLEQEILSNKDAINEVPIAKDGSRVIPNATQHNVPAWTVFAMFFIVVVLSVNVVKEKISGSAMRLRTLPTSFLLAIAGKQITYILITLAQVVVIFSLGLFLFPHIGLPRLNMPSSFPGLILVSIICGWCAVSYGVLIGVYAKTMEQCVGIGAVSVVILAAIGGVVVPAFAMPESLRLLMKISPLHWCIEGYYTLFLSGGNFKDALITILPLLVITFIMQLAILAGLKRQHLI